MKHEHNIQKFFRVFIFYNLYIIVFNQHINHYPKPKHEVPILIRYTNSRISKGLQISHLLKQGLANFFWKDHIVNISGFAGLTISVATTQNSHK